MFMWATAPSLISSQKLSTNHVEPAASAISCPFQKAKTTLRRNPFLCRARARASSSISPLPAALSVAPGPQDSKCPAMSTNSSGLMLPLIFPIGWETLRHSRRQTAQSRTLTVSCSATRRFRNSPSAFGTPTAAIRGMSCTVSGVGFPHIPFIAPLEITG